MNIIDVRKIQKEEKPQKRKQVVIDTSSQKEPTITTRGFEYTKAEVNEEDLEAIKKQIKTPFVKRRIERLAKAINTGKYGAVGSLLAKQTGEPYRTLTEEERKIAAQAIIDELKPIQVEQKDKQKFVRAARANLKSAARKKTKK